MFLADRKKRLPILMYHSISESVKPKFKEFAVQPALFAEQMAYLYQQGYVPITVSQLARIFFRGEGELPQHPIVLTFDDGFADFFESALPILKRYNFAATLYVATAFVGKTSSWLKSEGEDNRSMLSWEQLKEINMNGIECGAHSHSHPQLDILPHTLAQEEIVQSKRILEHHIGREVLSFAYPFGYYTARIRQQVQEAGYTSACAVKHMMSSETTNAFALARLQVKAEITMTDFATLLTGYYSSKLAMVYMRARTPVWQLARYSAASVGRRAMNTM